jgi:phosphatidylinositol-3-phosphatase
MGDANLASSQGRCDLPASGQLGDPLPGVAFPPGGNGLGGGRIGAVLLSPFIKPGTVSNLPYNPYSMLRSVEDIFGLRYLAGAAGREANSFGSDAFKSVPKP